MVIAVLALAGCMTTYTTTDGRLAYGDIGGTAAGTFEASAGYIYILHPSILVLGDNPTERLDLVVGPRIQAAGGNAATNLVIRDGFTVVDFLLSYFVPIVNWATVEVEGTAVSQ
ncbi:MAG: hypothetical protein EA382_12255 [Spirochaetaceae bacterium]|nr:MAG: hypothetical protein EA382_12255 [Spirochaetaceae bacterium]